MARARQRLLSDGRLVARVRAGDPDAFAILHERYRPALLRYARRLLSGSAHDPEDVVQEVLVNAHRALARDDRRDLALRPWLYALTRNRSIDALRRPVSSVVLTDDVAQQIPDPLGRQEPEVVMTRRGRLRTLVRDLGELPQAQRTALLGREVDGRSYAALAAELSLSEGATKMLVVRARENLVKAREARDADCDDVRVALEDAHQRGVRATEHVQRHLRTCDACADYKRRVRGLGRQLHVLAPGPGVALTVVAARVLGAGGKAGFATKTAAVAGGVAIVTGGAVLASLDVFGPGSHSPFHSTVAVRYLSGKLAPGKRIPAGATIVRVRLRVPAGPRPKNLGVTLRCPAGMVYSDTIPIVSKNGRLPVLGLDGLTVPYQRTPVHMIVVGPDLPRPRRITGGILCQRPNPRTNSLLRHPSLAHGHERQEQACERLTELRLKPGTQYVGAAFRGQPVAVMRTSASGQWMRVRTDEGIVGWARSSQISRHGHCPPEPAP
jgi:RNA polymerase sigma factor (sigma-70 family)